MNRNLTWDDEFLIEIPNLEDKKTPLWLMELLENALERLKIGAQKVLGHWSKPGYLKIWQKV
jgi:hypothetical protein